MKTHMHSPRCQRTERQQGAEHDADAGAPLVQALCADGSETTEPAMPCAADGPRLIRCYASNGSQ